MSDVRSTGATTGSARVPQEQGSELPPEPTAWAGWVIFGAMLMILVGGFQTILGLVALFDDGYYVVRSEGLVVDVDYTAWGWAHLVAGVVAVAAGFGLLSGATWARALGIAVATVSALLNFAFIAAFPFWSVTIIALDVVIIYAIAAHGRELEL